MSLLIQRTSSSDDNVEKQNQQCTDWIDQSSTCTLQNCQIVTTGNDERMLDEQTNNSRHTCLKSIMLFRRDEKEGEKLSFGLSTCFFFLLVGAIKLLTFIYSYYFNCSHAVSLALVCSFPCRVRKRKVF